MEKILVRMFAAAVVASVTAAVVFDSAPAHAQDYPNRPLRVIVPQPPGGGFDLVARVVADKLSAQLGQPVTVENRPGSGTLVGTEAAAKAPADGYTLLLGALANIALNPGLYRTLSYDPLRDFVPVGLAVSYSYTLVGRKSLAQNTLAEVIEFARANPGRLTYASAGNGSGQHVGAATLAHLAGVQMTHIPYKGAQAAYQDLLGDRVDLFLDITPTTRSYIEKGMVKALAVSSAGRDRANPGVPTVQETGVANLDMQSWFGYFAPAKTPAPALERLRAEFAKIVQMPDVADRFEKGGGTVLRLSAAETDALIRRDVQRWTQLIRQADIRAD